ncbi:GATA transcription factor 4-like [Rutidosis leptorrhynchoides]|uniref:GATA transcription factor 4-like n=1 Tax=Rutidosis leptorrhynchoides TaxID=125765 RepID=UPI003A99D6D1
MEVPEFCVGGYFSEQKTGDNFAVDDLLDFSNDDAMMSDGFFDNVTGNSADSSTVTGNSSISDQFSNYNYPLSCRSFADSQLTGEFCVPYDDMAELEWLSNFVEDSFSNDQNLQTNYQILSGSKPPTPESSSSSTRPEPANPHHPIFSPDTPLPGKARSKRSRAAPCDWSTRLLHVSPNPNPELSNKQDNLNPNSESTGRKCLHCASEKTPQWRTGPMGPKTLCNACGVRYKSGRLVPEYRPAASPTFISAKHSNSHRKVVELRRQKEMQRARQPPFLGHSPLYGVSDGGDEYLIHHHTSNNFGHII